MTLPRPPHGGVYCHLITRGVDRGAIFRDDLDRRAFMVRLSRITKECDFQLASHCLMTNHLHLIARAVVSLSKAMERLLNSYVQYFNERWDRVGPLFQDRFKLKRCLTDRYLKTAIRYVHLNPVKANMVARPGDWEWSSYREYLNPEGMGFTDRAPILKLFEASEYREWLYDLNAADLPDAGDFVPDEDAPEDYELVPPVSLEELAIDVMSEFSIASDLFWRPRMRAAGAARKAFMARAVKLGYSGVEVARLLGVSPAAVSLSLSRERLS